MNSPQELTHVRIVDIKMPFMSMVIFMVKWAIAAIPAFIILAILAGVVISFFSGFHSPHTGNA